MGAVCRYQNTKSFVVVCYKLPSAAGDRVVNRGLQLVPVAVFHLSVWLTCCIVSFYISARWNHVEDLDSFFTRVYHYHQKHGFACMMLYEILELL